MHIEAHHFELRLQLLGNFDSLSKLPIISPVALGKDYHELFLHLLQHFDEHSISILEAMHYVNQNEDNLAFSLRSMLQIVLDQLAPLQDLVFRCITGVSVARCVDQKSWKSRFDLEEGEFFGLSWLLAGLHKLPPDQFIDKRALPDIAPSKKHKLLYIFLKGNGVPNVIDIANSMQPCYRKLVQSLRVYQCAIQEGKKFILLEIDISHLFGQIHHTFPYNFFHNYILLIPKLRNKQACSCLLWSKYNNIQQQPTNTKEMDLQVICPLCNKQYSDCNLPRLFTICGHTYCEKCLTSLATEESQKFKVVCPEDHSEIMLEMVSMMPVNKALFNYLEARKNNTSTRSINSLKDESFNVPKINHSQHEDDDTEALVAAINGKEIHQCPEHSTQSTCVVQESSKIAQVENQLCLLHNKQVELVCLVDYQRLCSKCALFGQHRGHEFVSLDQVQQGNRKIYETLLQIFDEKAGVLDQLTSKTRRETLTQALNAKTASLKKEIADKFKKIHDEINKAERAVYHKLEEMVEDIEKKMRKLLVIDQKTVSIYESWALQAQKRFNSYESGTHQGLLQFYLSGKNLIQSGKDTIQQLRFHQQKSTVEAKKYIDDIGVFFNEGPCLNSLPKIAELFQSDKEYEKKMVNAFNEKENSKLFANCQFYEDIKKKVKTEAHEDDESLLELVDEFQQNHSSISTSSKILDESFLKVAAEKSTPTRMAKNAVNSLTPSTKVIPRKKTTLLIHKEISKDERVREEKKQPVMSKDVVKKKMRAIKIPEKYEKMLEGVLTDTLQAVDFTNAQLGDAMVVQICEILKGSTRARTLKLIRNKITDQGFNKIIPLLCGVSTLNLSQNLLTENCLNVLADLRGSLPNLKTIILSQNKIAQRKCKVVVEKLRKMDLTITI